MVCFSGLIRHIYEKKKHSENKMQRKEEKCGWDMNGFPHVSTSNIVITSFFGCMEALDLEAQISHYGSKVSGFATQPCVTKGSCRLYEYVSVNKGRVQGSFEKQER